MASKSSRCSPHACSLPSAGAPLAVIHGDMVDGTRPAQGLNRHDSRTEHRIWPIRAADVVRNVKQEAVWIAQYGSDCGCPSGQSIANPQKSAMAGGKRGCGMFSV